MSDEKCGKVLHIGFTEDYLQNRALRLSHELETAPIETISAIMDGTIDFMEMCPDSEDNIFLSQCWTNLTMARTWWLKYLDDIGEIELE